MKTPSWFGGENMNEIQYKQGNRYCLPYFPSQKPPEGVDELKIKYQPADRTLETFLETYKDKAIVIDVSENFEEIDAQLLKGLYEKYKYIKIAFNFNKDFLLRAQKYEIPYFFTDYVTSIDKLIGLMEYLPTDMYICEELGFFLPKVSKILHDNGIRVRVFPNICQSSFSETPSIKTFFIRPEDIFFYAQYVDTFELVTDKERQHVLFKIYKQEKWSGRISDIIPSFKGDLESRYVLDAFGTVRAGCGKRCMYKPGSCNICDRFIDTAAILKENKIIVNRPKKDN